MPFDNHNQNVRLAPTLENLSYVLRHKNLWPTDFKWNYTSHQTCAIGLSRYNWPEHYPATTRDLAKLFGMTYEESSNIFIELGRNRRVKWFGFIIRMPKRMSHITADDVADAIYLYLETKATAQEKFFN